MKWLSAKRQIGMTLLEVVVSMLIIGLGMSASIAMLQTSMQNNTAAINRNNAIYLSEAVIDKMRMNKFAVRQYLYGSRNVSIDPENAPEKSDKRSDCDFCGKDKNREEAFLQASKDINNWYEELQQKLPGAGFAIYNINPDRGQYGIMLKWPNRVDRSRDANAFDGKEYTDSLETIFTL